MKKSQFKEYLKTEVLKMTEATKEDIEAQKELNKELETTSKLSTQLFEADPEDIKAQQDLSKELDTTKTKVDDLTKASQDSPLAEKELKNSNKMKKSQFKEYLRNEILREMNEEEEEEGEDVEVDAEEEVISDEPEFEGGESTEDNISSISDDLVELAKKAKESGELELANQILNSAKFANKTKLKDVEAEI